MDDLGKKIEQQVMRRYALTKDISGCTQNYATIVFEATVHVQYNIMLAWLVQRNQESHEPKLVLIGTSSKLRSQELLTGHRNKLQMILCKDLDSVTCG